MKQLIFKCLPFVGTLLLLAGCGGNSSTETAEAEGSVKEPFKVVLQTDWYAQPEHGGFYQALAEGYYAEEGLDVTIVPGGPNALASQKIAQGTAQFAISRSDEVIIGSERGIPLVIIGALMQKDPQAIMFHEESGIETLADLDGRAIMAGPGSAFIEILKQQYGIDFSVIPLDYGMSRFLADKEFVQQCFITNEPFYVSRAGANVETILLSESGFNPYRVWFTSKSFLRRNPEVVAAFHRASIRGWQDYLFGDRTRANQLIEEANPKMDPEFMEYVVKAMRENNLVTGDSGNVADVGKIDPARIEEQIQQLVSIGMLSEPKAVEDVYHKVGEPAESAGPSAQAAPSGPLGVVDFEGRELAQLTTEVFSGIKWASHQVKLETGDACQQVRGVYLEDALAAIDLPDGWDLVLADCSDGYQSNYTPEVLRENRPFLILEIDGQSTADWCAGKGHPEWGPFMIQIMEPDGLLDPVNKNPWGVNQLRVGKLAAVEALLAQRVQDWPAAETGFSIFKGNCASCHAIDSTALGGKLSNRTTATLAMLALHAEDYFRKMLADPVGTNPIAQKMPAVTHYKEEHISDVLAFLNDYAK
jgi:NitT/TauT family transport system substrate-binding protein